MPTRSQRHKAEVQGTGLVSAPQAGAWVAGAGTKTPVPIANGRAKVECTAAGTNPRIVSKITNLQAGKDYRLNTQHYQGNTGNSMFYRIDDEPTIPGGDYAQFSTASSGPVEMLFTAPPSGEVYFGGVQLADNPGDYGEMAAVFQLTRLT